MKVLLAAWQALCLAGNMSLSVAAFLLWLAVAAVSGWMLAHVPDVWHAYLENQSGTTFDVAAFACYACVAGALFLWFSCGVLRMLADAYMEIRLSARKRRSRRAVSTIRRHQPVAAEASVRTDSRPAGAATKNGAGR
ncbi:hypothetical protein H3V53_18025 [Paraburkholderia bengalensis]|uniref:Uncharacterized protein n=1 Tax=Paraburkholderia bengalensis TaxID=2747562 RepID=A0ABU8IUD9_9BURK